MSNAVSAQVAAVEAVDLMDYNDWPGDCAEGADPGPADTEISVMRQLLDHALAENRELEAQLKVHLQYLDIMLRTLASVLALRLRQSGSMCRRGSRGGRR